MKRKPDHSKFIWSLPDKPRLEYLTLGRKRLVEIGAKVANFEPPYEYLKNVRAGFDAEIRFMLDRCLKGDPLACAARHACVFRENNWFADVLDEHFTAAVLENLADSGACRAHSSQKCCRGRWRSNGTKERGRST